MLLIKSANSIPNISFINKFTIHTAMAEIIICVMIGFKNTKKDNLISRVANKIFKETVEIDTTTKPYRYPSTPHKKPT